MTNETVEIIDAIVEEPVTPIAKIKTALKKVDTKVYCGSSGDVNLRIRRLQADRQLREPGSRAPPRGRDD